MRRLALIAATVQDWIGRAIHDLYCGDDAPKATRFHEEPTPVAFVWINLALCALVAGLGIVTACSQVAMWCAR